MEALDPHPGTGDRERAETFDDWWARLTGEDRLLVIDCVRLDQTAGLAEVDARHPAPGPLVAGRTPSDGLGDYVRRRPEYLQRFADAHTTAVRDDTGIGLPTVPDAHDRTAPILPEPER